MVISVIFEVNHDGQQSYVMTIDQDAITAVQLIGKVSKAAMKNGLNIKPLAYAEGGEETARAEMLAAFNNYPGSSFDLNDKENEGYVSYRDDKAKNALKMIEERGFKVLQ